MLVTYLEASGRDHPESQGPLPPVLPLERLSKRISEPQELRLSASCLKISVAIRAFCLYRCLWGRDPGSHRGKASKFFMANAVEQTDSIRPMQIAASGELVNSCKIHISQ